MLPESYQSEEVRLYKAIDFPEFWILDKVLFKNKKLVDTIFIEKENVFYWITTNLETDELELYYSLSFKGKWIEHSKSPLSNNKTNNRNAGAIIKENNSYFRVAQDSTEGYGGGVNLYEIIKLDKNNYIEKIVKKPLFYKKENIIKDAIHHVSVLKEKKQKIIAIDGANFAINKLKLKL